MWKQIDIEYLGRFGIVLPEDLQKNIEEAENKEKIKEYLANTPGPDGSTITGLN